VFESIFPALAMIVSAFRMFESHNFENVFESIFPALAMIISALRMFESLVIAKHKISQVKIQERSDCWDWQATKEIYLHDR